MTTPKERAEIKADKWANEICESHGLKGPRGENHHMIVADIKRALLEFSQGSTVGDWPSNEAIDNAIQEKLQVFNPSKRMAYHGIMRIGFDLALSNPPRVVVPESVSDEAAFEREWNAVSSQTFRPKEQARRFYFAALTRSINPKVSEVSFPSEGEVTHWIRKMQKENYPEDEDASISSATWMYRWLKEKMGAK